MRNMTNKRGLALLSVVVSAAILTIALSIAVTSFYSSSRLSKRSAGFTVMSNFAEGVMEHVRSRPFDQVRSSEINSDLPKLPEARCEVKVKPNGDGLKEVTVSCSWRNGKTRPEVKLSTLVARGASR